MDKKKLIALGLTDEQAESVLEAHKAALNDNYVPKHRFDEVNTELKTANTTIIARDAQISNLKKFEGDNAELITKIEGLEADNKEKEASYREQLNLEKKKNAVRFALLEDARGKPHDVELTLSQLDLDQIEMNYDTGVIVSGYDAQREKLGEQRGFQFIEVDANGLNNMQQQGFKVKGTPPADGDKNPNVDNAADFGKSLAQTKLNMLGVMSTKENS